MADYPHAGTLPGGDDPVAARTSWEPLVGGGTNFRTRNLKTVSPDRLEFPASLGAKLFAGVFAAFGLLFGGIGVGVRAWPVILFGGLFAVVGLVLFRFGTTPVVFDRRQGAFWRGREAPNEVINRAELKHYAPLGDIHALQLLSEYIRGDKSSYYSYELNLVLKNGDRLNVMDHGDYEALRRDAATLGEFLDRPVWDTVNRR